MELYHIHVNNKFDEQYHEGKVIYVGKRPNAMRQNFLDSSCTYVDQIIEENGKIKTYHKDLMNVLNIEAFNKLSVDKQFQVLATIRNYIKNSKVDFREMILEEVRRELHPDFPSRYNCMWLTDKECLDYWLKKLKTDKRPFQVFEVETMGKKPFVSTDSLLPQAHYYKEGMYEQAKHYWDPSLADLEKDDREYLYEGELRLTKRVM